jgi:AdoMet-dependent rRNA methyltransferase SPB1
LGQDDVFDLVRAENAMREGEIDDDAVDESDDDKVEEDASDDDVVLDSDQEKERKVMSLEAELDGLYDAYQDRLRERDARYKVMEARRKNVEREEWHGIQDQQDDDDSSSVGGWDERGGSDSSSEDSNSDGDLETSATRRKRPRIEDDTSHRSKRPRLVTKLEGPKMPVSKTAKIWFSQDVFAGIDNAESSEDEAEDVDRFEEDSDDDGMPVDEHSETTVKT